MRWLHKIELNNVLQAVEEQHDLRRQEVPCPDEVKELLAAEVRKAKPLVQFADQLLAAKSIAEMNRILDCVYDAADRNRVWCGL